MNILAKKIFVPFVSKTQASLVSLPSTYNFSKFFVDRDRDEMKVYDTERNMHPYYRNLRRKWMIPLEKKQKRKERIKQLQEEAPEIVEDKEKFIVHNPIMGIEYPVKDNEIFAVFEVLGKQYKVAKDDLVIADHLKDYDINDHIVFDQVYLVGTKHYTAIGRPVVNSAKVYATIEEQTISEKTLVLKYKRRKRSLRSNTSRVPLTVLRIDKIEHIVDEQLNRATPLI